jgi:hypothetical protein
MSNAKSIRNKPIDVKIGDETYKIRFTLNSFIELEDIYGSINEAMDALKGKPVIDKKTGKVEQMDDPDNKGKKMDKVMPNFKAVRDIFWTGLIAEHKDITKEDVGNILTMENITEVMPKINEALLNAFPEKVGEDEKY